MIRFLFLLCLPLLLPLPASAQAVYAPPTTARERVALDGNWRFAARPKADGIEKPGFDDGPWQAVTLPHTWNSKTDAQTRKAAWYRTHFTLGAADRGKEVFVYFEGAATVAGVYLNGVRLGQHRGAYTAFIFDGTRAAVPGGDNVLAVRCDTDPKDTADCLPAGDKGQLYHVYGGLYRRVWLLKTAPLHVDPTYSASSGVFLTPRSVAPAGADLDVRTLVRNDGADAKTVTVKDTVCDAEGQAVATASGGLALGPHAGGDVTLHLHVTHPHVWGLKDPYLYHVYSRTAVAGHVTDVVAERTGFRSFTLGPDGFLLNGVLTPLRGVAKHQETEARASAVTVEDLKPDWDGLRDLGVNYVRLAHYPHAALEYNLADERGIVVWAENGHSNPTAWTATGDQITREMVRQNYNHPSIVFWSIGNEALAKLAEHPDTSDLDALEHYARTARFEDPSRLITYASSTYFHESPALDFVAVNRYVGWYGGLISAFEPLAVFYHFLSETGAGGVLSTHTAAPLPSHTVNAYEPEEYQQEFAESRCQTVFRNVPDDVFLFTWWTFRDFGDPRYKGLNTKGLETYAGFRKDVWYLFQSFLRPDTPVVHVCGKPWFLRRLRSASDVFRLKAYSNAAALTLTLNGQNVGTVSNGDYVLPNRTYADNVFSWAAPFKHGRNDVTVDDGLGHSDRAVLYFEDAPPAPNPGGAGTDVAGGLPASSPIPTQTPPELGAGGTPLLQSLTSTNPLNPAYLLDTPAQAEWPVYDDFDGTGDNTFHALPDLLSGASRIVTGRTSKAANLTTLTFTISPDVPSVDVFLLRTLAPTAPIPTPPVPAGFTDTGVRGTWRDNAENLIPNALYRRTAAPGEIVTVPGVALDYALFVKPHP